MFLQSLLNHSDDNHIYEFLKSKLGFANEANFESRLYRCLPAFQAMDFGFYVRNTQTLLLPLYLIYVAIRFGFNLIRDMLH